MKKLLAVLLWLSLAAFCQAESGIFVGSCSPANPGTGGDFTGVLFPYGLSSAGECFITPTGGPGFNFGVPITTTGNLKHLVVALTYFDFGSSPASLVLTTTVYVNGAATALTCAATLSGGSSTAALVECSDSIDKIAVVAGDVVTVFMSTPPATYCGSSSSCPEVGEVASFEKGN